MLSRTLKTIAATAAIYTAGALAPAAPAGAAIDLPPAHVGDAVTDPITAKSLAVAQAHFGRYPDCPAGIQVTVDSFGDGALAYGDEPGCNIRVSIMVYPLWAYAMPPTWCRLIEHEYGHLLGLGHSTDPRSVMYPVMDGRHSTSECIAAFPAPKPRRHRRHRHTTGGAR